MFGFQLAVQLLSSWPAKAVELILKDYGAQIGDHCDISAHLFFINCSDFSKLIIGPYTHIGKMVFFDLLDEIIIGQKVTISMKTTLLTHQDLGHSALKELYPAKKGRICIGDNCYIGTGSTILQGVELGEGCMVAAGSVVTKSFPPYSLVAGTPAKVIRMLR
ncbi:MAG: acyltransferase [bacterium]